MSVGQRVSFNYEVQRVRRTKINKDVTQRAKQPGTPIFYRKARAGGGRYSRYRLRPSSFRQPAFSRQPHIFRDRWRTYRCRQARSFDRLRLSRPDLPTQPLSTFVAFQLRATPGMDSNL